MDSRGYHILVIEDNPGDFVLIEDFLFEQIESPVLLHAKDYKEATAILYQYSNIDVVLLDLSLPDKTGAPLIRDLKNICTNTPVIVLTGYSDFSFGVRSLSLGVSDYLLKDELTSSSLYKSIVYSLERKKNQAELEASEKRYSDLFNLSPLPMWVVDLTTLKFLDVNEATLLHYGYSREEFLNLTLRDIRPAEEMDNFDEALAEGIKHSNEPRNRSMVHQMKNGDLKNVEIKIAPIPYQENNVNIVIATDVTERLRYIKAIEDQNEQLKEISWMQSHIIRAPLSRIMGLIPLIVNVKDDLEDRETMLNFLAESADELDSVIKNITDKSCKADYGLHRKSDDQ